MITIDDFAKLSLHVYKSADDIRKNIPGFIKKTYDLAKIDFNPKTMPSGMYEIIIDPPLQNLSHLMDGFYASLYVKVQNNKAVGAVLAIRGTVLKIADNDVVDIKSWYSDVLDPDFRDNLPKVYLNKALLFYHKARSCVLDELKIPRKHFYCCGHSLGGALAALMPTHAGIPIEAVTFNAPGIAHIPGVSNRPEMVVNYRAKYDFVSCIDKPIGNVTSFDVPEKELDAKIAFELERLTEHSSDVSLVEKLTVGLLEKGVEAAAFSASIEAQHSMANLLRAIIETQSK